jgi:uncharacterized protein YcbK (DUF882 family)
MTDDRQLTPHFSLSEFRCPCCNDVIAIAALLLAKRLEPVRAVFGPIRIQSGFRCAKHNQAVKGAQFSQHLAGLAADIAVDTDSDRYLLIATLIECKFRRIGIGAQFVHADIGPGSPVLWTYYPQRHA